MAVIDLEDAVPTARKAEAREVAVAAATALAAEHPDLPVMVRCNAPATGLLADDVADGLAPSVAAVLVPMLDSPADVDAAAAILDGGGRSDLPVVAGLETVEAVVGALGVASHPRVAACYFGAEDYVSGLGGVRRPDNLEVLVPRTQVAQAAHMAGIPAIDMVVANFGDEDRFLAEAGEARALGYAGKICIHPSQVALAERAFRPTDAELDWAREVVTAWEAALGRGEASVAVGGGMVDEPVARRARTILDAWG